MTAVNPWHSSRYDNSKPIYTIDVYGKAVFEYRTVQVFRMPVGYLYVQDGMAITHRAGFKKESAPNIIDELLEGPHCHSPIVRDHLRARGFAAKTYEDSPR